MSSHIPRPLPLLRPLDLICACFKAGSASLCLPPLHLFLLLTPIFSHLLLLIYPWTPPLPLPTLSQPPLAPVRLGVYSFGLRLERRWAECRIAAPFPAAAAAGNLSLPGAPRGWDLVFLESVLTVSNPPLITPKSHRSERRVKILVGREAKCK